MNRLGFFILSILEREEAVSSASAMSAYEIANTEYFSYKPDSVYKKMSEFAKNGYVAAGLKDGKANTYYITEQGRKILEDARKAG